MKNNYIGEKYERLTILSYSHYDKSKNKYYLCKCDCGNNCTVRRTDMRAGVVKSCGCYNKEATTKRTVERSTTHGMSKTPTYKSWANMKERCYNSNRKQFYYWGGRGIKVCDRWINSFENFYKDMGEKTKGLTLDRINNNGDYEPSNCKWATITEQNKNRRPFKSKNEKV
jgi:hypothetical protein